MASSEQIVPVDLVALIEDQATANPIVVLHDRSSNRVLPIWIGDSEARAIAFALNNVNSPRPLTHKLLIDVMQKMGGTLLRIVIDQINNNTYYASIYIQTAGSTKPLMIDARPSDALAVGLESRVPIFVSKAIMDEAGQDNPIQIPVGTQQQKRELTAEELKRMKSLLEKARQREQQADGG